MLGVFDPDDPRGKGDLLDAGVDDLIARDAPPEVFVAAITALDARAGRPTPVAVDHMDGVEARVGRTPGGHEASSRGFVCAVSAAGGGTGATEVAIALAAACSRRVIDTVIVDTDEVAPALAQRLNLATYPNVRAAVDVIDHGSGALTSIPARLAADLSVVPGLSNPRSWAELHPTSTVGVLRGLTDSHACVIANAGPRLEDLPGSGGAGRYGVSRAVVGCADVVVGVAAPSPVGMARLLEWAGDVRDLSTAPVHVVFNRAPSSAFKRGELTDELARNLAPAGIWFLPTDARVEAAAWAGQLPSAGPFTKAATAAAAGILPLGVPSRRRWLVRS